MRNPQEFSALVLETLDTNNLAGLAPTTSLN